MSTNSDLYNNLGAAKAVFAAIASNTTTNGDAVATNTYDSVMFVFSVLSRTDGTYAVKIQESDDGSTGWSDIGTDNYNGSQLSVAAVGVSTIGCFGVKKYVRLVVTSTSVTTGATVSGIAVGHKLIAP